MNDCPALRFGLIFLFAMACGASGGGQKDALVGVWVSPCQPEGTTSSRQIQWIFDGAGAQKTTTSFLNTSCEGAGEQTLRLTFSGCELASLSGGLDQLSLNLSAAVVTPNTQGAADTLNGALAASYDDWAVGEGKDIRERNFFGVRYFEDQVLCHAVEIDTQLRIANSEDCANESISDSLLYTSTP